MARQPIAAGETRGARGQCELILEHTSPSCDQLRGDVLGGTPEQIVSDDPGQDQAVVGIGGPTQQLRQGGVHAQHPGPAGAEEAQYQCLVDQLGHAGGVGGKHEHRAFVCICAYI